MKTLEQMPLGEYETVIERFIEEAARWDGSLLVETFFDAWAALESRKDQVEVQAEVKGDRLVLAAPPDSSLRVQGNRIWFQDGRQVVIRLVTTPMAATG
jgi:hypothetical protein